MIYWSFNQCIKQCYGIVWIVETKADIKSPGVAKRNKGKLIILSKCALCNTRMLRFIKEQEGTGLLSSLGIRTLLSKIPLVGPLLF